MKRKLTHIILMLAVMTAMLLAAGAVAYADTVDEGTLGDDIVWTLDDAGTLTIQLAEGVESAAMPDYYNSTNCPIAERTDIKAVEIGKGITRVGDRVLCNCTELKTVALPEGLTSIGAYAFCGCTALTSIDLPEGLTAIGQGAFTESGLKRIDIPDSVTEIGEDAFSNCYYMKHLKISAGLKEINNNAFSVLLRLKSLEIPEGVEVISRNAFADCTELRELTLPASLKKIDMTALMNCISLEKVVFKGDFCVEMGAFYLCNFTAYYPLHNATWDEDAVDTGYGGKVTWVGYCDDPHPAAAVRENVKEATVLKAGSYDSVVYCKVCKNQISRKTVAVKKLTPTIKLSATKKTLKKKKSFTLKVSGLAKGDSVQSFKSSKKGVAAVTSKGKITAKKKGTAVITVTLKSGKTATCKVTVK